MPGKKSEYSLISIHLYKTHRCREIHYGIAGFLSFQTVRFVRGRKTQEHPSFH